MVEAGVNVVRMGEFAWGLFEPEEGKYDFAWMLRAMDLFQKAGIKWSRHSHRRPGHLAGPKTSGDSCPLMKTARSSTKAPGAATA
jgi:hypothetical protein